MPSNPDFSNLHFSSILELRMNRRDVLRGGVASAAGALFGALGLTACNTSGGSTAVDVTLSSGGLPGKLLGFKAVAKSLADAVTVPPGYSVSVLYGLGDPLRSSTPAFKNDGTDTDFENRAGDHHDGMEFFGLSSAGAPSTTAAGRGLLAVNHEATTDEKLAAFFLHPDGGTTSLPRPAAEADKEMAVHGVSVVEIRKSGNDNAWQYIKGSPFNRRLTPLSDIELSGPARGHALLVTKYSTDGTRTRGTLNNCGTGKTPWGTFVTGEENCSNYFTRSATDDAARGNDKSVAALKRYGRKQAAASRHGWESAGIADKYARWNIGKTGASLNGSDDYRNEMNGMGYIVELDPYDKTRTPKKRTALGRYAHESAAFGAVTAGRPLAIYMGDDSRNEYIYKFVSSATWDPADAHAADRMAAGDKYLDSGTLYAAKFNADGTGQWIALSMSHPAIAGNTAYPFDSQADICINARLAADAVGATKMDRPEWCDVNPINGEIYFALTNNSNRRIEPSGSSQLAPDAVNPRVYIDYKGNVAQQGNSNGHILRIREGSAGTVATVFTWDVYLFGAEAGADQKTVNLSKLTDDQDFSSPDGVAFSAVTHICWIQTDDGAYTDVTNCMMLAGLPGQVGDGDHGGKQTLRYTKSSGDVLAVDTYVGKTPPANALKRFLVGPPGCEITGLCETPDGKTLFVNIQHPGENTAHADIGDPAKYTSQWPGNAGYGNGRRPRSATIVITKDDGGFVGA